MKQDEKTGNLLVGTAVPNTVPNAFRGVPYINSIQTAKAAIKEYEY